MAIILAVSDEKECGNLRYSHLKIQTQDSFSGIYNFLNSHKTKVVEYVELASGRITLCIYQSFHYEIR